MADRSFSLLMALAAFLLMGIMSTPVTSGALKDAASKVIHGVSRSDTGHAASAG